MDEILTIQDMIYEIRGQRVMLDFDLAALYHVETRVLNQAVRRNIERFPADFMFQLSSDEWISISSRPKSAIPLAFTEHGTLMLASILRSDIAIEMSIKVTRAFVAMRTVLLSSSLPAKLNELEENVSALRREVNDILEDQNEINEETRAQLDAISVALAQLQSGDQQPRRPILGFSKPSDM